MTAAIDAKDSYTCGHSERVARIAVELARELGLSDEEVSDIYLGGLLHDIGKIGISDSILRKDGTLTSGEYEQIRQHVVIGVRILVDFPAIAHLLPLVRHHHERYDGTGYPDGLQRDEIPFLARILAVADGYDAMNTTRPYRAALSRPVIEKALRLGCGAQWDEDVVDAFFRAKERIYAIQATGVGESVCFALGNALRKTGSIPTLDAAPPATLLEEDILSIVAAHSQKSLPQTMQPVHRCPPRTKRPIPGGFGRSHAGTT